MSKPADVAFAGSIAAAALAMLAACTAPPVHSPAPSVPLASTFAHAPTAPAAEQDPDRRLAARRRRLMNARRRKQARPQELLDEALRAVGRHEDPHGLSQKSPVFPGIWHLEP
jgi:hypothetical protein